MNSFEKIKLPPLLIADLYAGQLVLVDEPQFLKHPTQLPQTVMEENPGYNKSESPVQAALPNQNEQLHVLGGFQKQVAIILQHPTAIHTDDASLDLLNKMLMAVKLSLADVAIINLERNRLSFPFAVNNEAPKAILLFGVTATALQLPLQVPHFQVSKWSNCSWLFVPELQKFNVEGADQKNLKTQLWGALKAMFEIA